MEWGGKDKRKKLEDWKAIKGEYPEAFRNEPQLSSYLQWVFNCWVDMGRSRGYDQGIPLPIPIGVISQFCDFFKINDPEIKESLFYFCGELDDLFCGYYGSEEKERSSYLESVKEKWNAYRSTDKG
ncbi:MAG: hypothetical protein FWD70_03865 [Desulfuromonadales bacterium]|nr:hypothetical protein [Desulfuromonadales bacterium]